MEATAMPQIWQHFLTNSKQKVV